MFYQKLHIPASSRDPLSTEGMLSKSWKSLNRTEVIACTANQYDFESRTILNGSRIGEESSTHSFLH